MFNIFRDTEERLEAIKRAYRKVCANYLKGKDGSFHFMMDDMIFSSVIKEGCEPVQVDMRELLKLNDGDRVRYLWSIDKRLVGKEGVYTLIGDQAYVDFGDEGCDFIFQGNTDILEKL